MKNGLILPYFKIVWVPIIVNPGGQGKIHETIWPKSMVCNSLTQGPSLSLRPGVQLKWGKEAENVSGHPPPYSNHHSV